MDHRKWLTEVFKYHYIKSLYTEWQEKKTKRLAIKYVSPSEEKKATKTIKKQMKQIERNNWRKEM